VPACSSVYAMHILRYTFAGFKNQSKMINLSELNVKYRERSKNKNCFKTPTHFILVRLKIMVKLSLCFKHHVMKMY
jgi:hypothetical protein